jgi:hypothetical protein
MRLPSENRKPCTSCGKTKQGDETLCTLHVRGIDVASMSAIPINAYKDSLVDHVPCRKQQPLALGEASGLGGYATFYLAR